MKNNSIVISTLEFFTDISSSDILNAVLILSNTDCGVIESIRTSTPLPVGYYLFTAQDIVGKNNITILNENIPIFAKEIEYSGQCVGVLVGKDIEVLHSLQANIKITYREIEFYEKEKLINSKSITTPSFNDDIFSSVDNVFCHTWSYPQIIHKPLEPYGVLCKYKNSMLTVYTVTKWTSNLLQSLTESLCIPLDKITLKKTNTGFDDITSRLWETTLLSCITALASIKTGMTVKLLLQAPYNIPLQTSPLIVETQYKTLVKDEKFIGQDIDIKVDAGAFCPFSQEIIDRLCIAANGIYVAQNMRINISFLKSRRPPSIVLLDTIESSVFFAIENQIHYIACAMGINPISLRLQNINTVTQVDNFPFVLELSNIINVIDVIQQRCDFLRKFICYNLNASYRAKLDTTQTSLYDLSFHGIGLSCAYMGSGYLGSAIFHTMQNIEVSMENNGKVIIKSPTNSPTITKFWKQICAKLLEIDEDDISIKTEQNQYNNLIDDISCNISIMTKLLKKCCTTIQKKRFINPLPLTAKKNITTKEKKIWNIEKFCGNPFYSIAVASCVIDMQMDMTLMKPIIHNIYLVIDCGKLLDLQAAVKTIKISVLKLLHELCHNIEIQDMNIEFIKSSQEPTHINEIVRNVVPAAFFMAIKQATNKDINSLPITFDNFLIL